MPRTTRPRVAGRWPTSRARSASATRASFERRMRGCCLRLEHCDARGCLMMVPSVRRAVGLTTLAVRIGKVADRRRTVEERMLVDSGAIFAVVPAPVLRRLGIRPHAGETFTLADGSTVTRSVGSAFFEIGDRKGASNVIFGRPGDASLLGVLTLEALRRELRPLPMMLA